MKAVRNKKAAAVASKKEALAAAVAALKKAVTAAAVTTKVAVVTTAIADTETSIKFKIYSLYSKSLVSSTRLFLCKKINAELISLRSYFNPVLIPVQTVNRTFVLCQITCPFYPLITELLIRTRIKVRSTETIFFIEL
jgi:hypothetical protein